MRKNFHHITPRSRSGNDSEHNLVYVEMAKHKLYHRLFGNKTPDEVIDYLWTVFGFGRLFERPLPKKKKPPPVKERFYDPQTWWWDT